jgi:hypothetical protein
LVSVIEGEGVEVLFAEVVDEAVEEFLRKVERGGHIWWFGLLHLFFTFWVYEFGRIWICLLDIARSVGCS